MKATHHPGGMADNSPTFQRWVLDRQWAQVPKGRLRLCTRSAVPSGLIAHRAAVPNVETLGYCRKSLRDKDLPALLPAILHATLLSILLLCSFSPTTEAANSPARQLKLLTPSGYLPQLPLLVRIEVIDSTGRRDWSLWDAEATLTSDSQAVSLSTNRVVLRNGLGSVLVSFLGDEDFNLIAALGSLQTNHFLRAFTNLPVTSIGGVLPGPSSSWSGLVLVTNDVIVPLGHTLTIQSNTFVLIDGVTNGTIANDLSVSGTVLCLGTEAAPVTITCSSPDLSYRWGQIRHNNAQPSLYRYASINRGGRSTAEGQTGTAPAIRPLGSAIVFENCNLTDFAETSRGAPDFGRPGKVMLASLGSDITFNNCLMARARMGPEINGTALLLTNSYIVEMYGSNDSDGIFLAAQEAGQTITLTGSVIADGDDDGIDTLGVTFTVENCLIRNWRNPFEDSKGISLENAEARIRRSLLVDNAIGISGKGDTGVPVRVRMDHSTVLSEGYALGATNKTGTTPIIEYRITNSILHGTLDSVFTQYNPADIHIYYCNLGESWLGPSNNVADPFFVNAAAHDYHLQTNSPCIDAGDPTAALDPDGSRNDIGYLAFVPPPPLLGASQVLSNGTFRFQLSAYPHRNYVVEFSTNLSAWAPLTTITQALDMMPAIDPSSTNTPTRLYRVHLAP